MEQLNRTSALMDRAIPDALVTGHEILIAGLTPPDPDDRHVLAAAIRCNASVIVTFNEKGFPTEVISHYAMVIAIGLPSGRVKRSMADAV